MDYKDTNGKDSTGSEPVRLETQLVDLPEGQGVAVFPPDSPNDDEWIASLSIETLEDWR